MESKIVSQSVTKKGLALKPQRVNAIKSCPALMLNYTRRGVPNTRVISAK